MCPEKPIFSIPNWKLSVAASFSESKHPTTLEYSHMSIFLEGQHLDSVL